MKDRIKKLLTVKSIVTLVITGVFAFLAIIGKVTAEQLIVIYTAIIGFYFGTQAQKKADQKTSEEDTEE